MRNSLILNKNEILPTLFYNISGFSTTKEVVTIGQYVDYYEQKSGVLSFTFNIVKDNEMNLDNSIAGIIGTDILDHSIMNFIDKKLIFKTKRMSFDIIEIGTKTNINDLLLKIDTFPKLLNNETPITNKKQRVHILKKNINFKIIPQKYASVVHNLIENHCENFYINNDPIRHIDFVHHLRLNSTTPVFKKQFPIKKEHEPLLAKNIMKLYKAGVIEKCNNSSYNSPVFMVEKKNTKDLRFILDLRAVNELVIPNQFQFLPPSQILDNLQGKRIFTKLDLKSSFYQISIAKESRMYTAFTALNQRWQMCRLPMGLKDSISTFTQALYAIFDKHLDKFINIYVDDLIIYSDNESDHIRHLEIVFDVLTKNNLTIEASKCEFFQTSLEFLGYQVGNNTIKPSISKTEAILKANYPHNLKTLRAFLGLTNFFRRFIKHYAQKALPLYDLLKKDSKFIFTQKHKDAVDILKNELCSYPIINMPNENLTFTLETDASADCIGGMLAQYDDKKISRVTAYYSRTLNQAEKNYSVFEREFLAITECVTKTFHKHLVNKKFFIITDHLPILHYMNNNIDTGPSRIIRARIKLMSYDFKLIYRPGKLCIVADYLSRFAHSKEKFIALTQSETEKIIYPQIAVFKVQKESLFPIQTRANVNKIQNDSFIDYCKFLKHVKDTNNNKNQIATFKSKTLNLKDQNHNLFFVSQLNNHLKSEINNLVTNMVLRKEEIITVKRNIFVVYKKNYEDKVETKAFYNILLKLRANIREQRVKLINIHSFYDTTIDVYTLKIMLDYLFRNDEIKIYIIKNEIENVSDKIRQKEIISEFHDQKLGGHCGIRSTMNKIKSLYFWPHMENDIKNFIKTCDKCQMIKTTKPIYKSNEFTEVSNKRFHTIAIDTIGPMPLSSKGNRYALTITDTFTRYLVAVPLPSMDLETTVDALIKHYFCIYGFCERILSDNAKIFVSEIFNKIMKLFNIKHIYATPYFPQSNSILERIHFNIKTHIRTFIDKDFSEWDEILPFAVLTYNSNVHSSTGFSPYELTFGNPCNLPFMKHKNEKIPPVYNFDDYHLKLVNVLNNIANLAHEKNISLKITRSDKIVPREWNLEKGDLVKIINNQKKNKLDRNYLGPYKIIENHEKYVTVDYQGKEKKINKFNLRPYYARARQN
jgi:hypothetical protein